MSARQRLDVVLLVVCALLVAWCAWALVRVGEARGAEILFLAADGPGGRVQGQVRGVQDDGYAWGAQVLIPPAQGGKFCRVRITGVTRAQVLAKVADLAGEWWGTNADGEPYQIERSRWRVEAATLPAGVRATLNQTGLYETTYAAVRAYIKSRVTGEVIAP